MNMKTNKHQIDGKEEILTPILTQEQTREINIRLEKYVFPALFIHLQSPSFRNLLTGAAKCSEGSQKEKAEFFTELILERGELANFLSFTVLNLTISCTNSTAATVEYVVPKIKEYMVRHIEKHLICLN